MTRKNDFVLHDLYRFDQTVAINSLYFSAHLLTDLRCMTNFLMLDTDMDINMERSSNIPEIHRILGDEAESSIEFFMRTFLERDGKEKLKFSEK